MAIRKRNVTWSNNFFLKLYYASDDFFKHFTFKFWWVFFYIFFAFFGAFLIWLVNYNYTPSEEMMKFSSSHYSFNQGNYDNFQNSTNFNTLDSNYNLTSDEHIFFHDNRKLQEEYLYNIPEVIPFIDYLFTASSIITGAALFTVPLSNFSNASFVIFSILAVLCSSNVLNLLVLFYKRYRYYKIKSRINTLISNNLLKSVDKLSRKNRKIIRDYDILIESLNLFIKIYTSYLINSIMCVGFLLYFILTSCPLHPEIEIRGFNRLDNAFFLAMSAFCNLGLSMSTDSLLFYYNYARIYLVLGFLILIGNTGLPIFLRYYIVQIHKALNFYYHNLFQNDIFINSFLALNPNSKVKLGSLDLKSRSEMLPENQNEEYYYREWNRYLKNSNYFMNDSSKYIKDPKYYYYNLLFFYILNNSRRLTVNLFNRVKTKVLLYMLTFLICLQFSLFLMSILTLSGSLKLLSTKVSSLSGMVGGSTLSSLLAYFNDFYSIYLSSYLDSVFQFFSSSPRDYFTSYSTRHLMSFLASTASPSFSPTEAPINTVLPELTFGELSGIGFFQTFALRSAGFTIIDLRVLNHGILFFYLILMYTAAFPFISTLRETEIIGNDSDFEWNYIKPEEIEQLITLKNKVEHGSQCNIEEELGKINPLLLKKFEMINTNKNSDMNSMFLSFEKNLKKMGKSVTNKVVQNTSDLLHLNRSQHHKKESQHRGEELDANEIPRKQNTGRSSFYNPISYINNFTLIEDDCEDIEEEKKSKHNSDLDTLNTILKSYYNNKKDEDEEKKIEEEKEKKKKEEEEELTVSDTNPLSGSIIRKQFTNKFLLRHTFFLLVAIIFLLYSEDELMKRFPGIINPFIILFEIISAYGCVGLTLGIPGECVALSAVLTTTGKLVIIGLMILGKHRGLPSNEDEVIDFKFNSLRHAHGYIEEDLEAYFDKQGDNLSSFLQTKSESDVELGTTSSLCSEITPLSSPKPSVTSLSRNNSFSNKSLLPRSFSNLSLISNSSNVNSKNSSPTSVNSSIPSVASSVIHSSNSSSRTGSRSNSRSSSNSRSIAKNKNLEPRPHDDIFLEDDALLIEVSEDEDL